MLSLKLPGKCLVRLSDCLTMTIAVDCHTKQWDLMYLGSDARTPDFVAYLTVHSQGVNQPAYSCNLISAFVVRL